MLDDSTSQLTLAEENYRRLLEQAPCFPWRQFSDGSELVVYAIFPDGHQGSDAIPSVLFFHGGMWRANLSTEFIPWATQLATRGIASFLPCYRTRPLYDVSLINILDDAQEFWLWAKENASILGLDPQRISVAGSDAGGLMALHVAMPPMPPHKWFSSKPPTLPDMPAAVALFRGVVDIEGPEVERLCTPAGTTELHAINPWNRIHAYLPPLFASQGTHDPLLDWKICREFVHAWGKKNQSLFEPCDRMDHTYYHFNVNPISFEQVYLQWADFMVQQGIWTDIEDDPLENILN